MHSYFTNYYTRVIPKVMSNNFLWIKIYCYAKTKYIILIHRLLLNLLHNPRSSVHIYPTVLEAWIFPCGRPPFRLPEDIDAQLSGVPRSPCNVGLASDSSQNQRDGSRRVPDQDCTEGARSGLYGGWGRTSHPMFSIFSRVKRAVWGRALSCCRMTFLPGRLSRNARRSLSSVWT